jgi:hypothetical protein
MKTVALAWMDDLSVGRADATACGVEYDAVVTDLAGQGDPLWFGHFTLTAAALDEEIKDVPEDCVRVHAVFYRDRMLSRESVRAMEALDPAWRTRRHAPQAYLVDHVDERQIRLWPPSDQVCDELGWLYTQQVVDAPAIMDLPLALLTLAREYSRESPHRDPDFAAFCAALGARTLQMVAA